jgi:hypothetical protein
VKALQKAPQLTSVNVGIPQQTESLIDQEVMCNQSKENQNCQAHMTTALAAAVSSSDIFTTLAVDQIQKKKTIKPREEHIQRDDFEPPNREYMQQCSYREK